MPLPLDRFWSASRIIFGLAWSGALVMLALACIDRTPGWVGPRLARASAVTCFAAGQFVLMVMVLDAAFPRARGAVTWGFELTAGLVFWGGCGLCLYLVWVGRGLG